MTYQTYNYGIIKLKRNQFVLLYNTTVAKLIAKNSDDVYIYIYIYIYIYTIDLENFVVNKLIF